MMNLKGLEGSGCGLILRCYTSICLEGLRKITKKLSQDSRSPVRDLNPGPRKYEAEVLTIRPRRSVVGVLWVRSFKLAYMKEAKQYLSNRRPR
jgi:hypothetical protein